MARAPALRVRWNLIWYLPLAGVVFWFLVIFDAVEGYRWAKILITHWTWGVLISPAAYFWWGATIASITIPAQTVLTVPAFFNRTDLEYAKRYKKTAMALGSMLLLVLTCWFVAWASFPLDNGTDGIHMRMIPFLPWPSTSFFG